MDPPPPTTLADLSPLARALAASLAATALVTAYRVARLLAVAAAAAAGAGGGQGSQQPEEEEEVERPARRRRLSPPEKTAAPAHRPRLTETAAHALPCAVVAVAVADSGAVAAAGADAAVRVWPPPARSRGRAAAPPHTLALAPEGTSVADVAATPDGGWAVLTRDGAGGGGEVVTFDQGGAETATHPVGRDGARPAFLAAADTGLVVVTDKAGVELVGSTAGAATAAGGVRAKGAAGAAGRVVVATLAPALPVFTVNGRRLTGPTFSLTPPGGPPTAVAAAGRAVAVAARDKSVTVFDLPSRGRAPAVAGTAAAPPGTPEPYRAVAVSGDGAIVVAAAGRALHVLTPRRDGSPPADQTTLPADAAALAMADGLCVVGCDDGSVRVFRIE